jgi:hypothetical protein
VDHKPLQQLVKDGKLEIQGEGTAKVTTREQGRGSHEVTHGRQHGKKTQGKGDR